MPDARSSVFPPTGGLRRRPPSRRSASWVRRARRAGVALLATGGSGALASVVGVARAFEDRGTRPALISLCSGSALFGFPIAAGFSAAEVAEFVLALRPADYVDVDWRRLMRLAPTLGRGFAGIVRGARLEATYREFLGDITLGELPIPAYAPIWNVEENRLDYLGPRTHPDVSVARAVRMAVALPLFIAPVALDGLSWCDGGIVDIFPVRPALDIEPPACAAVAVNGFYPPDFAGEDVHGWERQPASIVTVAGQVRTCQQAELARGQPPTTAGRNAGRDDRARAVREGARTRLLPAVPQYARLGRLHDRWPPRRLGGAGNAHRGRAARARGEGRRIAIVRIPDELTRSGKPSNPRRGHAVGAPESDDRPSCGSHTSRRNAAIRSVKR